MSKPATMPCPEMPITPAASTDIKGQEKSQTPTEVSFSLGPPAIHGEKENSESSNASVKSDSSYHPSNSPVPPPSSASRKRARPSMSQIQTDVANTGFSLPPPPSRSRKIIQMKPGPSDKKVTTAPATEKKKTGGAGGGTKSTNAATASKKTARKTAHSVIERRRRSKMNEEFDTMKDMIPACRGQSMHKLAILQAGIDYLRYLEKCVADLKAANRGLPSTQAVQSQAATPRPRSPTSSGDEDEDVLIDEEEQQDGRAVEEDSDEEMSEPPQSAASHQHHHSFTFVPSAYSSTQPSPANSIVPQNYSFSRSSTLSSLPSPAFKPLSRPLDYSHSVESSPALLPNSSRDADHEATAALLMLNSDRRGTIGSMDRPVGANIAGRREREKKLGGGLSVQDLLSG